MTADEEDVLDMAAADSGVEDSQAETNLGKLSNLIQQLKQAQQDHADASQKEKDTKAVVHDLEQRRIPDLMRELRIAKTTMDDGSLVSLKRDVSVSIPADRREEAYDWAESNGHQGIVKTHVSVAFGKGEFDDAQALVKKLATVTNKPVELERSINAMTLKSFVKGVLADVYELKAENKEIPKELVLPDSLFTVFEYFKVDIKTKTKK